MKKVLKWLGILVLILVILIGVGFAYINFALPDVEAAPDIKVDITPERVERGKYLANSVVVCMDCHSTRDWSQFGGPVVPGTYGAGGEKFDKTMGFPGNFYSKNITPYGLKDWTDGEVYRAITAGVNKDGEPLFPVMPYHNYGKMAQEDIYSIIAYVRTLPPVESNVPERSVDFPFSLIMRTIPKDGTPGHVPEPTDVVAYGEYLVNAAACIECHTKVDKGQIIPEFALAGGREFELPGGTLRSANITPANSGIGYWTQDQFIAKFKQYQDSSYRSPHVDFMHEYNTIMPWLMYSTMSDRDLAAIYAYLKTVKPIDNDVVKWTARK